MREGNLPRRRSAHRPPSLRQNEKRAAAEELPPVLRYRRPMSRRIPRIFCQRTKNTPVPRGGSQGCKALFARFHLVFSLRLCRKPYSLTRKNGNAFACGSGVVFTADTVRNFHRHPLSRSARHRLLFPSSPFACIIARPPWFVKGGRVNFFTSFRGSPCRRCRWYCT